MKSSKWEIFWVNLFLRDMFTNAKELGIHAVEIADEEEGHRTCGIEEEQIASCEV